MTTLGSPYNFVPLSPFILRPDWAAQVSHDHPFRDGISGELKLQITARSPLCVGGHRIPATETAPSQVHFYRDPDSQPAIPGTSIKGMLRNVLAIASFGHFRQVQDKRFGVRDISRADNFYSRQMNRAPVHSGWLRFEGDDWQLTVCERQYVRIHHRAIIDHFKVNKIDWLRKSRTAESRYQLVGGPLRQLRYDITPYKNDCMEEASNVGRGTNAGYLVITGQPGRGFDDKSGKKREFLFAPPGNETLRISHGIMADFMLIHENSDEWKFWRRQIATLKPGVPVFFHYDDQKNIKSLGLARMYRLAYEHSLHDAIGHTQAGHIDDQSPDLVELLFGHIDQQPGSLRGRVSIGAAPLDGKADMKLTHPMVLNAPKPTFYPAYLRQQGSGQYLTLMDHTAELAGWKRYPAREYNHTVKTTVATNNKVQVQLETLPAGSTFQGSIRLHNLRLCELGALLWTLDFGSRGDSHHHSLGTGKPLGFGQVSMTLSAVHLRPNQSVQASDEELLAAAREAFYALMNQAWRSATGQQGADWEKSEQLQQLLAMADPSVSPPETQPLEYPGEPKQFADAKKRDARWRLRPHKEISDATRAPRQAVLSTDSVPVTDVHTLLEMGRERLTAEAEQQRMALDAARQHQQHVQRQQEKANLDDADRLLADISDWLAQLAANGFSKTLEGNLAKAFNHALVAAQCQNTDYADKLHMLAREGQMETENAKKTDGKLGKAIRKVLR